MTEPINATDPEGWNDVELTGDPFLVLGRRRGRKIECYRLDLHEDLFDDLRVVCDQARQLALTTRSRPYEPNAELEGGEEHFDLAVHALPDRNGPALDSPAKPSRSDPGTVGSGPARVNPSRGLKPEGQGSAEQEGASEAEESTLVTSLRRPDQLHKLTRPEFDDMRILLYAVCWQQSDGTWVAFVRKTNPRQVFHPGRRWCQYSETLKRVQNAPSFVYDDQIDAIIKADRIAGFSASTMKNLFNDVGLAMTEVPAYVSAAAERIEETLPLSGQSQSALLALGQRRQSIAVRLYALGARLDELASEAALTTERYQEVIGDDEEAAKLIVNGEFDFDEEGALVFLDVIEGRYFDDDWTGIPRRADRWSRR
ncbi:hypothetical protein ACFPK1_27670 [Actinomycetospora rhizophila]|uniref:Uncharacterized protein n=1 Tax=Actinomycetospora rhizophila TaxID=1416876 RepID=A0ABV9ZNG5_9PSEU